MTRIGYLSKNRGVTLAEALIASFIVAISIFAVGTAIYSQITSLNQNREKAIATLSAQEEIENIRGMSFDAILSLDTSFNSSGFAYLKDPVGTVIIDNVYGANDMRRVSVTVSWRSINGNTLQKKLVTLVTRSGIDKQ